MTDISPSEAPATILAVALQQVAFDGWSARMLGATATACGCSTADIYRWFPGGVSEMVDAWFDDINREMTAAAEGFEETSIRGKIRAALLTRFEILSPHREAVRQTMIYFSLPGRQRHAAIALYRTVDAVWHAIGVSDTDFNFYTKRVLLAGVYSSTLLYWLTEEGADAVHLAAFMDRRIAEIMRIQKGRGRIERRASAFCSRLPSPLALAARLRFGRSRNTAAATS